MSEEKNKQLGQNYSAAAQRLLRDLLWDFVKAVGGECYRCGKPMTRATFSIEHIVPWLHSGKAKELFFDLGNISYSHKVCNYRAARRVIKHATEEQRKEAIRASNKRSWTKAKRRKYYLETGK